MVIFHSYVNVYQRVASVIKHGAIRKIHDNPLFTSMLLESLHLVICQICEKMEGNWNNYGVNLHEISWDTINCRRIAFGNSILPHLGFELEKKLAVVNCRAW